MYSSIEELQRRMDVNILQQLSDDNEMGITVFDILTEALNGGTRFADNAVPGFVVETNPGILKEVELLKAQAILLRRKGYYSDAAQLDLVIKNMIESAILNHTESGRPVRDSTARYHTTTPIVSASDWRDSFGN